MFVDSKLRLKSTPRGDTVIQGSSQPPDDVCRLDNVNIWHVTFCKWLLSGLPDQSNPSIPTLKYLNLLLADKMSDVQVCVDMACLLLPALIELSLSYADEACCEQTISYIKRLLGRPDHGLNDIKKSLCMVIDQLRLDRHQKTDLIMREILNIDFIKTYSNFNSLLALYYSSLAINLGVVQLDIEMAEILQGVYLQLENVDNVIGVQIFCQKTYNTSTNVAIKARYCDALGLVNEARACRKVMEGGLEAGMGLHSRGVEHELRNVYDQYESRRNACRLSLGTFSDIPEYSGFSQLAQGIQQSTIEQSINVDILVDNCLVSEVERFIKESRMCNVVFAEKRLQTCVARLSILEELRCFDLNAQCTDIPDSSHLIQHELELYYTLKRMCLTYRTDLPECQRLERFVHFCIRHSELCRASGERGVVLANDLLMQAELLMGSKRSACLILERAKWLNSVGRKLDAIRELESSEWSDKDYESMSLLVKWKYESALVDNYQLLALYQRITKEHSLCERAHFELARFLDHSTGCTNPDSEMMTPRSVELTVKSYCESIVHGSEHQNVVDRTNRSCLYQSLPRLFTLWFLSGRLVFLAETISSGQWSTISLATLTQHIEQLTLAVRSAIRNVSSHHLLRICISQLISRLCHPHPLVSTALLAILARVLIDFPFQTIWRLISVSQSSYKRRQDRCHSLFEIAKKKSLDPVGISKAIADCLEVGALFAELCERPIRGQVSAMSMKKHFPALLRRLCDNKTKLLLPLHSQLFMDYDGCSRDHTLVFVASAEDKISILQSLQKPKQISLRGSDGKIYKFLCKSKDDLRIDHRFLEVANIVNHYLPQRGDSELGTMRLYAVTPLSELCGLIEWMPDHVTLNTAMAYPDSLVSSIRQIYPPANTSIEQKLEVYDKKIIPKFVPSRLPSWFRTQFAFASEWYLASKRFTFSAAAWSMLGYIMGLGDRHCDNIMLDQTSGQCVHVDFNCLFNKGDTLPVPEIVPFRLTHNLVDSLGPIGIEGHFRRSCEKVLSSIRDDSDLLLNVLETFVFDPLVEWKLHSKVDDTKRRIQRRSTGKGPKINDPGNQTDEGNGEIFNSMARIQIGRIKNRLNGCVAADVSSKNNKSTDLTIQLQSRGLSVEGHVNLLIQVLMMNPTWTRKFINLQRFAGFFCQLN